MDQDEKQSDPGATASKPLWGVVHVCTTKSSQPVICTFTVDEYMNWVNTGGRCCDQCHRPLRPCPTSDHARFYPCICQQNKVCEHGSLRRKCEICERDVEITDLQQRLDRSFRAIEECELLFDAVEFNVRLPTALCDRIKCMRKRFLEIRAAEKDSLLRFLRDTVERSEKP